MVFFMDDVRGRPVESLFAGFMTVDRPMSCMLRDVGAPVLARSVRSSWAKARHSGPVS